MILTRLLLLVFLARAAGNAAVAHHGVGQRHAAQVAFVFFIIVVVIVKIVVVIVVVRGLEGLALSTDKVNEGKRPTAFRLTGAFAGAAVLSVGRFRLPALRDDSIELDDDAADEDELLKSPWCGR